ncbi:MAG: hypothetical protein WD097_03180 [Balneolales bacterium]
MNELYTRLNHLVTLSREMLKELEIAEPSLDTLESLLQQRNSLVNEMGPIIHNIDIPRLLTSDQHLLTERFHTFRSLHEKIGAALNSLFDKQKVLLGTASKKRKAEEQYHVQETPDISYFTDQ